MLPFNNETTTMKQGVTIVMYLHSSLLAASRLGASPSRSGRNTVITVGLRAILPVVIHVNYMVTHVLPVLDSSADSFVVII